MSQRQYVAAGGTLVEWEADMRTMVLVLALGACTERKAQPTEEEVARAHERMVAALNASRERERMAREREQVESEHRLQLLEQAADTAQKKRDKAIKKHFPAKENALENCIAKNGGPRPLKPDFMFGASVSLAYKLQIGDEALAQRFLNYVDALSRCTAYGETELKRALLPFLSYLGTTADIGMLVAVSGDLCARIADSSIECFSSKAQALMGILGQ
jgi:head-tail adaptor